MGRDTNGRIKGFVDYKDLLKFIKNKYDKDAKSTIKQYVYGSVTNFTDEYKINEHSEDDSVYYSIHGFICFKYNDKHLSLFYDYSNLNFYENLDYYKELDLTDMVKSETVRLILRYDDDSIDIIKSILHNFNGGWLNEDDYDEEKEYYWVD